MNFKAPWGSCRIALVVVLICGAAIAGCGVADNASSQSASLPSALGSRGGGAQLSESLPGGVRGQGWELAAGHWGDGEAIFKHTCGLCHETGVGPELRGRQLPAEAIAAIVRNGNGAMLAVRQSELSDAEVDRVSKWIEASTAPKAQGKKP